MNSFLPKAQFRTWKTSNWGAITGRGYNADEMRWLEAQETSQDFNAAWAAIEQQFQARGGQSQVPAVPGAPSGPGAINFPPIPSGASTNEGAKAFIQGTLDMYGLGGLADWAWKEFLNGMPIEAILLEMRKRPEYKSRFPAMEALAKKGRALTEQQYIDYERGVSQIMHGAGLPGGFYDKPDDFTKFLTGDVSLPEIQDRVTMYAQAAYQVAPEVRAELNRLYGINEGGIAAYFMDEKRALPLLQQQWASSQIGAQSGITGYGQLDKAAVERLAALGVTPEQAQSGFTQLGLSRELFNPLEGGEATTTQTEQLAAAFEGNIAAQEEIAKQARRRQSVFEGGGTFAGSPAEGYTGVGSAR
jgi:hypothetical protein